MLALALWLVFRKRSLALSGFLLAGAAFSCVLSVVLLPFAALGILFLGIGVLGYTPMYTAFVFIRNLRRAGRGQQFRESRLAAVVVWLLVALAVHWVPAAAQVRLNKAMDAAHQEVLTGSDAEMEEAIDFIVRWRWVAGGDRIQRICWQAGPTRREQIQGHYQRLTGKDLEETWMD